MPPITERPDAVARDPLLGVLHRRHPDVDIVVLPPQRPPVAPPRAASLDEVVAMAERCERALEELTAGHRTGPVTSLWWRQGTDGAHRRVVRTVLGGPVEPLADPVGVLVEAAERLSDDGWRVRRRLDPRPCVRATRGPLTARVDAFPGAVGVEVLAEALVLDAALLRQWRARERRAAR